MRIDDIENFEQFLENARTKDKTVEQAKAYEDVMIRYQRFGGAGYITRKQYQTLVDLL
jgi:hypothetical protein